jgi:hypothetical protein
MVLRGFSAGPGRKSPAWPRFFPAASIVVGVSRGPRTHQQHPGEKSCDQAPHVGGEVCRSVHGAEEDVVEDEDSR